VGDGSQNLHRCLTRVSATFLGIWLLGLGFSIGIASDDNPEKITIGWIETVQILPDNFQFSAKIDTGADNSSLGITNPTEFHKEEEPWIRFTIPLRADHTVTLERPIHRFARIKRKGAASIKKAVVLLDLCVGTLFKKDVPVNLADRTGFKYPMLIGRSFLKGSAIVDVDLTLTQPPACSVLPSTPE
jgi:hypothetical protein